VDKLYVFIPPTMCLGMNTTIIVRNQNLQLTSFGCGTPLMRFVVHTCRCPSSSKGSAHRQAQRGQHGLTNCKPGYCLSSRTVNLQLFFGPRHGDCSGCSTSQRRWPPSMAFRLKTRGFLYISSHQTHLTPKGEQLRRRFAHVPHIRAPRD
jgi:hypothetical protein